jgi:hypothetical protein
VTATDPSRSRTEPIGESRSVGDRRGPDQSVAPADAVSEHHSRSVGRELEDSAVVGVQRVGYRGGRVVQQQVEIVGVEGLSAEFGDDLLLANVVAKFCVRLGRRFHLHPLLSEYV